MLQLQKKLADVSMLNAIILLKFLLLVQRERKKILNILVLDFILDWALFFGQVVIGLLVGRIAIIFFQLHNRSVRCWEGGLGNKNVRRVYSED